MGLKSKNKTRTLFDDILDIGYYDDNDDDYDYGYDDYDEC